MKEETGGLAGGKEKNTELICILIRMGEEGQTLLVGWGLGFKERGAITMGTRGWKVTKMDSAYWGTRDDREQELEQRHRKGGERTCG
jgi:hypothetical protein